jgi:hypothetical protein
MSLGRTSTALGAFLPPPCGPHRQSQGHHRHCHKLALLVYRALSGKLAYHDPGAANYLKLNRARELKSVCKRAQLLGFELVDRSGEALLNPVS